MCFCTWKWNCREIWCLTFEHFTLVVFHVFASVFLYELIQYNREQMLNMYTHGMFQGETPNVHKCCFDILRKIVFSFSNGFCSKLPFDVFFYMKMVVINDDSPTIWPLKYFFINLVMLMFYFLQCIKCTPKSNRFFFFTIMQIN